MLRDILIFSSELYQHFLLKLKCDEYIQNVCPILYGKLFSNDLEEQKFKCFHLTPTMMRPMRSRWYMPMSPFTTRLWSCLPADWFSLTYNLNCLKKNVNRHLSLLIAWSFYLLFFFTLIIPCLTVVVKRWVKWNSLKIYIVLKSRDVLYMCV